MATTVIGKDHCGTCGGIVDHINGEAVCRYCDYHVVDSDEVLIGSIVAPKGWQFSDPDRLPEYTLIDVRPHSNLYQCIEALEKRVAELEARLP